MLRALLLVAVLAPGVLAGETARTEAVGLRFAVPTAWTRVPAPSDVRAAQWRLPRAAGDAEDGEAILFFFGAGKGGGAAENLERWYGQFTPADGRAARDAAVITKRTVHGLRVTSVDLAGAYRATPLATPKPGFRLLAAVIEGSGGPWFLKVFGPEATVAEARDGFEAVLASLEAHR
jgi:hypothetical protein